MKRYFKHKEPDYPCVWIIDGLQNGDKIVAKFKDGFADDIEHTVSSLWRQNIRTGVLIEIPEAEFVLLI